MSIPKIIHTFCLVGAASMLFAETIPEGYKLEEEFKSDTGDTIGRHREGHPADAGPPACSGPPADASFDSPAGTPPDHQAPHPEPANKYSIRISSSFLATQSRQSII
jgi:hypothetical protein